MGIRQALLIVALATASFAQDISAKADQFVSAFVKQNRFSGVVLVANHGKPIFEKAYGMANNEWGVPNTMDTRFRLGSVTKQFTAAGILKLEEMGKLKVSDKACDYLPACPEIWKPVSIHQLLTHTSGIPSFTDIPGYTKVKAFPSRYDEQVKLVWEMKMDFDPGTRFQYSNTGYVILGKIIDRAGGMPWEDFLRKEIFLPAGMNNTMHDSHSDLILKRAAGYRSNGGPPVNASYIDMRIPGAAGALVSTAGDLHKWDRALASAKVLTEASRNRMWTVEKGDYAYGWIVQKQPTY